MRSLALSLLLVAAATLSAQAADTITIARARSRATPAGAPTAVGFLTITNTAAVPDRLIAVSSPAVDHVEIHEMAVRDGVMTMRRITAGLPVPAHGSVALKSGGLHLMLIGLKAPFKAGDAVPVTLVFEHAGPTGADLEVEPIGGIREPAGSP